MSRIVSEIRRLVPRQSYIECRDVVNCGETNLRFAGIAGIAQT